MKESKEQSGTNLETLELKANLNPEQREYLEVLKDKMKKVLGGKTKQELAKAGDLESLKNYKSILQDILDFLRTKEKTKVVFWGKELYKAQADFLEDLASQLVKVGIIENQHEARRKVAWGYHSEDGKITQLNFHGLGLRNIPDLNELSELTFLTLTNNKLSDLPGLGSLKKLTQLQCFNNNLVELVGVENLKKLKSLMASGNKFSSDEKIRIEKNLPKGCKIEI